MSVQTPVGRDPSGMAEPLSAADRSSLAAEQGPVTMGVGGLLVFEAGPGLEHARVRERVEQRLHLIPRYRQRLQSPAPAVTNPVWVDDDQFDLGWHVRRAALPAPGGPAELAELVGHELSRRLDRARPLWELTVIEGVAGGERGALLAKMHHALVDGVAAVDIGTVLLDPSEEPLDLPAPDGPWEARPYDRARHLARLSLEPMVRGQRLLAEGAQRALAATDPRRAAAEMRRATDLVTELARTRPQAPMTPLNRSIGPNRRYAIDARPGPEADGDLQPRQVGLRLLRQPRPVRRRAGADRRLRRRQLHRRHEGLVHGARLLARERRAGARRAPTPTTAWTPSAIAQPARMSATKCSPP
jgi:diacylglycerol O-acyltransferase / wax synthase